MLLLAFAGSAIKLLRPSLNACRPISLLSAAVIRLNSTTTVALLRLPETRDYFERLAAELNKLRSEGAKPEMALRLQYLETVLSLRKQYTDLIEVIDELVDSMQSNDKEFRKLAENDRSACVQKCNAIEKQILELMLPPSPEDLLSEVIFELSAGIGGQEAMLFCKELFRLYQRYAAFKGWKFDVIEYAEDVTRSPGANSVNGLRSAVVNIAGDGVYRSLRFEAGVHRVIRVPATELRGRMHTSAACVVILPQPTRIDIVLNNKDLKVDTFRASGKGGQHVNKTDSAVRLTHLPTGTVVENQTSRVQGDNYKLALKRLAALLYLDKVQVEQAKRKDSKKLQISSRDRSDKIRTYNYPQDRITDHRTKQQFPLLTTMEGKEEFDRLISCILTFANEERLLELVQSKET